MSKLDEAIWALAEAAGVDEEVGIPGSEWAGIMRNGRGIAEQVVDFVPSAVPRSQLSDLVKATGVILHDANGSLTVSYYVTDETLREDWAEYERVIGGEMEPNRGAPTPATLEDGTTVSVPDIKIMAMHSSYRLEPARGFAASLVVMSGQRSIGWMPIAVTGFDSVRDWMNGRGMAANARGTRNFRWGPCPYCGAEGWDTERSRGTGQFDHDRPQGGRCLQAAKAKHHVPNARTAREARAYNESWPYTVAPSDPNKSFEKRSFASLEDAQYYAGQQRSPYVIAFPSGAIAEHGDGRQTPNARGGADETAGWNEEAREDARLMAEFHRLDARLRKTAEEKGENSAAFRADYAKLQRAKKQVSDARERHAATRTSRPFR